VTPDFGGASGQADLDTGIAIITVLRRLPSALGRCNSVGGIVQGLERWSDKMMRIFWRRGRSDY
jgi:hypothetical protein